MRTVLAIAALTGSAALGAGAPLTLRRRLPASIVHVLVGAAGAGLGAGSLLLQHGVRAVEWIVVLVVLAALLPVHVRLLFHGEGPLRV